MKKCITLQLLVVCHVLTFAQVGIGTTTPSSKSLLELNSTTKGLLLPRLTSTDRIAMNLTAADAGMMIYQTSPNKGSFVFDGNSWFGLSGSSVNGSTLRWDETTKSWTSATNLFNQGSSIGINTQAPKTQLHLNSNATHAQLLITNVATGALYADGLLLGVYSGTGIAHIIQQENKPLLLGTNGTERMRVDSVGNIGIGNTAPQAKLDINGSVKVGQFGTPITNIMKVAVSVDVPLILGGLAQIVNVNCPNVIPSATVHISPGAEMNDIMICYARVNTPNNIEIKFVNLSLLPLDQSEMMFYITVIQ